MTRRSLAELVMLQRAEEQAMAVDLTQPEPVTYYHPSGRLCARCGKRLDLKSQTDYCRRHWYLSQRQDLDTLPLFPQD
jgi:hypothetical protein